jgi:hypothetical protein
MTLANALKSGVVSCTAIFFAWACSPPANGVPEGPDGPIVFVNQGAQWTDEERQAFYKQDQGARIMPLSWMRALKQADGSPFLADSLSRYGYLPNPTSPESNVPVGFTVANKDGAPSIGMTCAACHTRQIDVAGKEYRIDGGPAFADFQSFLADIDTAVGNVVNDGAVFDAFATSVLGTASAADKAALKGDLDVWYQRWHTLITRALPNPSWGPARLDAISMIFNRLTGLDIGAPPSYLLPDNIFPADAPARYPFLWNAARQDKTQWLGFAENGNDLYALARNLGQVYGVFGEFHPIERNGMLFSRDYIADNSANFDGLFAVENAIWKIGPPEWRWEIDEGLASQGKGVFERTILDGGGGCAGCHRETTGEFRSITTRTLRTPVQDVRTDARQCSILDRTVSTGVLRGQKVALPGSTALGANEKAMDVLKVAVVNSILQYGLGFREINELAAVGPTNEAEIPEVLKQLNGASPSGIGSAAPAGVGTPSCAYASRVLKGIWATAPYLHNGSVPTLADLLEPAANRPDSFKIGPTYNIEKVGLSQTQTKFDFTLQTTGCDDLTSGNSRCGHEYGATLSKADKKALLEYLKRL